MIMKNGLKISTIVLCSLLAFCFLLIGIVCTSLGVYKIANAEEFDDFRSTSNLVGNPFFYSSEPDSDIRVSKSNNMPTYDSLLGWRPLNYSAINAAVQSTLYSSSADTPYATFYNYPSSGNRYFCYPLQGTILQDTPSNTMRYALYARFRCDFGTTFRLALYYNDSNATGFSSQVSGSLITKPGTGSWDTVSILFASPFSLKYGFLAPAIGCSANGHVDISYVGFYQCPDGSFTEPYYRSDDYIFGYQSGYSVGYLSGLDTGLNSLNNTLRFDLYTDDTYITPVTQSSLVAPIAEVPSWLYLPILNEQSFDIYSNVGFSSILIGDDIGTWQSLINCRITPSLFCSFVDVGSSFSASEVSFVNNFFVDTYEIYFDTPSSFNINSCAINIIFRSDNIVLTVIIYRDYTLFHFMPWYTISPSSPINNRRYINLNSAYSDFFDFSVTFNYLNEVDSFNEGFNKGFDYANSVVDKNSASYQTAMRTVDVTSASYIAGRNSGLDTAANVSFYSLMGAVFEVPVQTFISLTNFDFLGINIKNFILSLLTLAVIIFIVKLLIGR